MKTKLHLLRLTVLTVLLGFQYGLAQTGAAFNGPHTAGMTSSVIQFEDFNLGANQNASVNPTGTQPFGYFDSNAGLVFTETTQLKKSTYRETLSDVELLRVNLPLDLTYNDAVVINSAVNEFLYYTVEFSVSGKYHIDVNYAHGNSTGPRSIKFERVDTDLLNPVTLVQGTVIRTGNSFTFATNPVTDNSNTAGAITTNGNTLQFDLAAGTYIIKATTVQNGPNYNWFQIVRDGDITLSNDTFEEGANTLKVFPNPATDGQFQLNIETKWDVYTVLGQKVLTGEGKNVNLSSLTKGIYLLKTPFDSKMLVSK